MEKLSLVLWRERELLDTLLYRLEQERLLLASGRTRWLVRNADEIEAVLVTIRETDVLRAVAAGQAAASVGLPPAAGLRALADAAGEPFRSLLLDHHEPLETATTEVAAVVDANRRLVLTGYRRYRGTSGDHHGRRPSRAVGVLPLHRVPNGACRTAGSSSRARADTYLPEVAYQAALAATSRVLGPSLLEFLR